MTKPSFKFSQITPLFFTIIVDILGFGLVFPILISMFNADNSPFFSSNTSQSVKLMYLGIAFSIYPFCMFFGAAYLGDLSDILGRKKVLMTSMVGVSLGFLIMGISVSVGSLTLLFIGRALSGLFSGSQPAALAAIADMSTPETKPLSLGYIALANSLGFIIGPLLGGILSDPQVLFFFNYSVPFYFSTFLALIMVLWLFWGFNDSFSPTKKKKIHPLRCFLLFIEALEDKKIRTISGAFFLMQLGLSFFIQLILIYLQEAFHYSTFYLGLYNGFIGVFFAISLLIVLRLVLKILSIYIVIIIFLFATGIFQLLMSLFPYELSIWIFGALLALCNQIAYTAFFTCYSDAVSHDKQGWVMGISSTVLAVTFTIAGFETNLVSLVGVIPLIFIGALLFFCSGFIMIYYSRSVKSS